MIRLIGSNMTSLEKVLNIRILRADYFRNLILLALMIFIIGLISATRAESIFDQDGFVAGKVVNKKSSSETQQIPTQEEYLPYYLPSNLSEVNSTSDDIYPCISSDGLTIYFTTDRDGNRNIYMATRLSTEESFTGLVTLPSAETPTSPVNTDEEEENCPSISSDGLTLYFSRTPDGSDWNECNIYYATRTSVDDVFDNAQQLSEVNSSRGDSMPCISEDGLKLYFASNRDNQYDIDIYVASRESTSDPFSEPTAVDLLNSTDPDLTPYIARDGYSFYLARIPTDVGNHEIYISTRMDLSSDWGTPEAVTQINSDLRESGPCLLYTSQFLYFSVYEETTEGYGGWDIWSAGRTVDAEPIADYFPETVYVNKSTVMICVFRNIGGEVWSSGSFNLGITGDVEQLGSDTEAALTADVGSGDSYQFGFNVKPVEEGTFSLKIRMMKSGVEWFGDFLEPTFNVLWSTDVDEGIFELYD